MNIEHLNVRDLRVFVVLAARHRVKPSSHIREGQVVVLVARRQVLLAYNRQVRQLPGDLQRCECGLIEIGRRHARNFDAGHAPSGGGTQRVLTELCELAERVASPAVEAATPVRSVLDAIRARCADRITCSAVVVGMCDSGV